MFLISNIRNELSSNKTAIASSFSYSYKLFWILTHSNKINKWHKILETTIYILSEQLDDRDHYRYTIFN